MKQIINKLPKNKYNNFFSRVFRYHCKIVSTYIEQKKLKILLRRKIDFKSILTDFQFSSWKSGFLRTKKAKNLMEKSFLTAFQFICKFGGVQSKSFLLELFHFRLVNYKQTSRWHNSALTSLVIVNNKLFSPVFPFPSSLLANYSCIFMTWDHKNQRNWKKK